VARDGAVAGRREDVEYSTLGGDGALLGLLRRACKQEPNGSREDRSTSSSFRKPGSIASVFARNRRRGMAIDGETLVRILLAWQRGEARVCAMVVPPTPEQEDRRRTSRERAVLLQERVRHVNRIKGLLASQGITDYEPLHKDRRAHLVALKTGDGQPLPMRLKAELLREIELVERLIRQISEVEVECDTAAEPDGEGHQSPDALLAGLRRWLRDARRPA
jgi:transposase